MDAQGGSKSKRSYSQSQAIVRVAQIAAHFRHGLAQKDGSALSQQSVAKAEKLQRHIVRGLLAHLILVPPWVIPPGMMIGAMIGSGLPFGWKGVTTAMGIGGALVAGPPMAARAVLCALLGGMACASRKSSAIVSAALATVMCGIASMSQGFGRLPRMVDFIMRWAPHFYREAEVRGALQDINPQKSFFGWHPHGVLCAGFTINGTFNPKFLEAAGKIAWLCDPALRHRNPGFRLLCEAYKSPTHAIEACDAASFKEHMGRGENVSFIPGGFLDAVAFQYGKDRIVLKDRTAFIKYCLQFGYRVHPVYTFGECETYYTMSAFEGFRMRVARNNIPMAAFFGFPIVPFLPRPQAKILSYVGTGIDFPLIPSPSNFDIAHWHAIYVAAVRRLFDENKAEAGFPEAHLEIL